MPSGLYLYISKPKTHHIKSKSYTNNFFSISFSLALLFSLENGQYFRSLWNTGYYIILSSTQINCLHLYFPNIHFHFRFHYKLYMHISFPFFLFFFLVFSKCESDSPVLPIENHPLALVQYPTS